MSRRSFVALLHRALLALPLVGISATACRENSSEHGPQKFSLGLITDFSAGVNLRELERLLVLREDRGATSAFRAVSLLCTHQTCLLSFQGTSSGFQCPCHGSRFSMRGEVLHGPATESLPWYQLQTSKDGMRLVVDRHAKVAPSWELIVSI